MAAADEEATVACAWLAHAAQHGHEVAGGTRFGTGSGQYGRGQKGVEPC